MRLPQSSTQPFFLRLAIILFLLTLTTVLPLAASTQQLVCTPSSLTFGAVTIGQTETQLIALSNAGSNSITISASSLNQSEFTLTGLKLPAVIAAGQTVEVQVTFTATTSGFVSGDATFTSNASNPTLTVAMSGGGVKAEIIAASPESLSFGNVSVGKSATLTVSLTNPRSQSDKLVGLVLQGAGFKVTGPKMPLTLSSGQSVKLTVTFTPQAAGLTGGSVYVSDVNLNIPFYGTGVATTGQLAVDPASLNFGDVQVGTASTQSSTLTATGGSVTVSSATSSNSQYAIEGISFPLTIAAGQSVTFNTTFKPSSSGNSSATLTFVNNSSISNTLESEAGTGTMPYVTLSWSPGEGSNAGYNVYRGTSPGSYSKINTALDPQTTFVDNAVTPGATYYYAATSVDSAGQESGYSAPIEVGVP